MSARIDANLQLWQNRAIGDKLCSLVRVHYQSGQANPPMYRVVFANHRYHAVPNTLPSGRITFAVQDVYWQGNKLQIKQVYNADPLALGMNTAMVAGWSNLHGFQLESIPTAGERHCIIRVNGTGLTFADVLEKVTLTYPSP